MDEPLWLRGAAVAAALAGIPLDEATAGFAPDEAAALSRVLGAFGAAGEAAERARAIARARVALQPSAVTSGHAAPEELGAWVLASVLRGLDASGRVGLVRAFEPASVRRAAGLAGRAVRCDAAALATLLAQAGARAGRMPDAGELGWIARAALGGDDARAPAAVHATLRFARAVGAPLRTLFSPFASEERAP